MTDQAETGSGAAPSARGAAGWALFLLMVVYTSNFIDRQVLGILQPSIRQDMHFTALQSGLLGGPAFALFYSILGIPIARLAERFNRVNIISISLGIWSLMTAACGLATGFWQLFFARMGVGVGEAGCSPAAQSLISDHYPPQKRSTALSIYSLGIPFGTLFGAIAGGWLNQFFSWRNAFLVVGLPGLLLALVTRIALREPPRGRFDATPATGVSTPGLSVVFKRLFGNRSWRHLAIAAGLCSLVGYGAAYFTLQFLLAGFHLQKGVAATGYGLVAGLGIAIGTALGGLLTDFAGRHNKRMYALIPALSLFVAGPLYAYVLFQTDITRFALLALIPLVLQYFYLGPTFAVTHNLVEPRMRASATALLFLVINLIGLGIGPPLIGWLSDLFGARAFTAAGVYAQVCPGGFAGPTADAALKGACAAATYTGIRNAFLVGAGIFVWSGVHYLIAALTLKKEPAAAA
jgi:MFS family permease